MDKIALNIGDFWQSPFGKTKTLGDLVSLVLQLSLVLAGLVLLFLFIIVGLNIVVKSGSTNAEDAGRLKNVATNAARGFVIIFVAYWIIRVIELIVGQDFITGITF